MQAPPPIATSIARWVLRMRVPVLVITLAATAVLGHGAATRLQELGGVEAFLATESPEMQLLEQVRDEFGQDETFAIVVEGDVFSQAYLRDLSRLHGAVSSLQLQVDSAGRRATRRPEADADAVDSSDALDSFGDLGWGEEPGSAAIERVSSLVNARDTTWRGGALVVGELLSTPPSSDQMPAFRTRVLADGALVGRYVGAAGRHSQILVRPAFLAPADRDRLYVALAEVADGFDRGGFRVRMAGWPSMDASLNLVMVRDLNVLGGLCIAAMTLLLTLIFRSAMGVVAPLLVVVQAALWMLGAMAYLGVPMTIISNVLPPLVLCVSIGDAIHVMSVYRGYRRQGVDREPAIVDAVASTAVPITFTTLTTAAGMLSFLVASTPGVHQMGIFGAIGVTCALLHSLVFLPALLSFDFTSYTAQDGPERRRPLDTYLWWIAGLTRGRRAVPIAIAGVGLTIGGIVLAGGLPVSHYVIDWFPHDHPVRQGTRMSDRHISGADSIVIRMEALDGRTLDELALLQKLERLEEELASYTHPRYPDFRFGSPASVLDLVRETWKALHENDPAALRLPGSQRGVSDALTLFESAGRDEMSKLLTLDRKVGLLSLPIPFVDTTAQLEVTRQVEAMVARVVGDAARVELTGSIPAMAPVVEGLLSDMLRSFAVAALVITLLMIIVLRDLRLGLLAMLPNLLPVAFALGFMRIAGIPVDMSNMLIASIAIGIAVDDTVHFLFQFQRAQRATGDVEAALEHAFDHAGRAMTLTTLVLAAGFSVYFLATMKNIQLFGGLIVMTVVVALLSDLLLVPALLRTLRARAPSGLPDAPRSGAAAG